MRKELLIAAVMMAALMIASCASEPLVLTDQLGGVGGAPEDFTLELSILVDPGKPAHEDIALQPSRYVLFSDGTLHYAPDEIGGEPGRAWLPPPVRRLDHAQVAGIWSRARELGLTDPAAAQQPTNFRLVPSPVNEALYLVRFGGNDRRWDLVRRVAIANAPDEAMRSLVRHLARLAWADERIAQEIGAAPKRYDFGPDPYARYRQSKPAK